MWIFQHGVISDTQLYLHEMPSLFLPGELYYRRIFQMLSNAPNIYFDNSIRWLPGFNGSNLRVLRLMPTAHTHNNGGKKYEDGMNKIALKTS